VSEVYLLWWMDMQGDECPGRELTCVDRGVLVGMRHPRLGPRLHRTRALCGPYVSRRGISPSLCGRRTLAELHIQDIGPRMLPSSPVPRRRVSHTHPCRSLSFGFCLESVVVGAVDRMLFGPELRLETAGKPGSPRPSKAPAGGARTVAWAGEPLPEPVPARLGAGGGKGGAH
jgi:hypothetical protein